MATDKELTGYNLSRAFWDYSFENPDKVRPIHAAIFFFAIEHCNRLGWKEKFGLPTSMALEAIGMKSYSSYKKAFDDLADWGFIKVIEYSKNQYSSNVVALSKNVKAHVKALDKATSKHTSKHTSKQRQSTSESTVSIDKPVTNTNQEPLTIKPDFNKKNFEGELTEVEINTTIEFCSITYRRQYKAARLAELWKAFCMQSDDTEEFYSSRGKKIHHFRNWIKKQPEDATDKRINNTGNKPSGTSTDRIEALKNWGQSPTGTDG